MVRRLSAAVGVALLVSVAAGPGIAHAQGGSPAAEKAACLTASDKGQQAKIEGKLRIAREQFMVCSRSECPALVRQDCAQWTSEVMNALPSVVIGARDGQGHDVFNVKVSLDGVLVAEALDGKPLLVDPGVHSFRYESTSAAPVEEKVLIREGEKNRSLTVQFPAPPSAAGSQGGSQNGGPSNGGGTAGSGAPPGPVQKGPPSPLAYVFTGLGVAALGTSLGFLIWGNNEATQDAKPASEGGCKPGCPSSRVSPIQQKWDVSGAMLGLGIASLGVATYFFVARPTVTPATTDSKQTRLWFDLAPAPQGAVGFVGGRF